MRHLLFLSAVAALLLTAGCVKIDYVGREFNPTPESEPVAYYLNRSEIPPGEFRIIGRATLTAPDGTDGYDIKDELQAKARACGADAVCQVRARKLDVGLYDREETDPFPAQKPLDPANTAFNAPSTQEAEKAEYGDPIKLQGEKQSRKEVVVQALFLKKKAEVEKLIAEQEQEVNRILGEKPEPSRAPAEGKTEAPTPAEDKTEAPAPAAAQQQESIL